MWCCPQTWLKSASYQSQRPLSAVGTARVCLQDGGLPTPPIVATTADGGIVSLHRDTMTQVRLHRDTMTQVRLASASQLAIVFGY